MSNKEMKGRREKEEEMHPPISTPSNSNEPPTYLPISYLPNPTQRNPRHRETRPSLSIQRTTSQNTTATQRKQTGQNKRQCGSATRAGRWVVLRATRRGRSRHRCCSDAWACRDGMRRCMPSRVVMGLWIGAGTGWVGAVVGSAVQYPRATHQSVGDSSPALRYRRPT
jgi:hypothetical protein